MGHNKNFPRVCALAVSVCIGAAITSSTLGLAAGKRKAQAAPGAAGQTDEAAQKQQEAAAAHASYDAGVKAYQAGKYEPAVQSLSAALRGGGLSSTDMAHALFYRGVSYKKQSKPGLAISDLTSSLWLKNGLTDAERANATAERADAYRLAGLGDGNSGAETVSVSDPNKTAAAKTVATSAPIAAPQAQRAAAQAGPNESLGAQSYVSASVADGAAAPVAATRASRFNQADQQLSAVNQNEPAVAPSAAASPVLSAAPMDTADTSTTATSGAASTVSGFFSNMFGGAKANSAPAPVTTASTTPAPAASSWKDTTSTAGSVAAGKSAKAATGAKAAAAPAPDFTTSAAAPAAASAPVKGGKYKIHIAAVRSKAEAEALAQKLVQQHGAALASRSPTVDEAVIGSMGTFYRVRIGSFATAEEPRGLCNTLRTSGVDCLVVTN